MIAFLLFLFSGIVCTFLGLFVCTYNIVKYYNFITTGQKLRFAHRHYPSAILAFAFLLLIGIILLLLAYEMPI